MLPNKLPSHYAAVVISGKPVSIGCSGLAGCSKICKHAVTRHAEMDAINKVKDKNRLRKASLWSVRWKMVNGEYVLGNAKPCQYCRELAKRYGIKTVYYSDDAGTIQRETIVNLESKLTVGSIIHLRSHLGFKDIAYHRKNNVYV